MEPLYNLSKLEFEISNDELELFNRCFKSNIGIKRNKYSNIIALIERDKVTSK